ncbi:MAG: cytochrome c biogenesis protein CcdA [Aquificota bacterium]|nr:cytochrome c biogenesis protein CcdA [Aquificota bacterium]
MNLLYLIPFLGAFSFFTPCMWNLNLLLRAYVLKGGMSQLLILFFSRLLLFNLIALFVSLLPLSVSLEVLLTVQSVVALVFILGFPLMRRLGIAPFDLSLQFFFSNRSFPPGLALGFSLPYCSLPFIALLVVYSLYLGTPFLLFNIYALSVTLPAILIPFLREGTLRFITHLIPSVPALTGLILLLSLGLFIDFGDINLRVSSLLQERHTLLFLFPVMFLLGFLTSLGPTTLPFLPVVFGILVTRREGKKEIFFSVLGFSLAFLATHALAGVLASAGAVVLSEVFRTDLFNLLLSLLLLLIALSLLNLLPISIEVGRLNPFGGAGTGSFALGVAYTFSLCPSCTSLLLGAIVLSATTENIFLSALLMGVYAVGRAVPVFLSGLVVSSVQNFLRENYAYINKAVGLLFLLLSGYFFKNFLEVIL